MATIIAIAFAALTLILFAWCACRAGALEDARTEQAWREFGDDPYITKTLNSAVVPISADSARGGFEPSAPGAPSQTNRGRTDKSTPAIHTQHCHRHSGSFLGLSLRRKNP